MSLPYLVLKVLSDGAFHSGQALAQHAGVTRAAIWKAIRVLQSDYNLDIYSVRGRGYRLAQSLELLDRESILNLLDPQSRLQGIEIFLSIDSTNQYLMQRDNVHVHAPWGVLAEQQTAGRGRRGRTWQSPFAGNLYLSLLWRFNQMNANFIGLSLVIGVLICRLLQELGVPELCLKWPNDVLCRNKKLCGILVEMRGESSGPFDTVIGIGLNLTMPNDSAQLIDQPWIALDQLDIALPSRNVLAARFIQILVEALPEFETQGLRPFIPAWRKLDCYRDREVILHIGDRRIQGIGRGIDEQGALLVEHQGMIQRYYSGEITLRTA
jgi:BirA family biotin operon repressor/biotin-[acetyl-CoA-carboxylase] ligase